VYIYYRKKNIENRNFFADVNNPLVLPGLSYLDHSEKKMHIKIIQYQSVYYHGHTKKCFINNNAEEQSNVEKTLLVSQENCSVVQSLNSTF
jgi:hypothetical protein